MSAVKFLEEKGIYGLDTKKRYNEVIAWMEEYAASKSTPAEDWVKVLEENWQIQIAGYYNHDKTPEEKKIRNAVIQEYQDLIAIFKHNLPSPPKKINHDK